MLVRVTLQLARLPSLGAAPHLSAERTECWKEGPSVAGKKPVPRGQGPALTLGSVATPLGDLSKPHSPSQPHFTYLKK